MQQATKIHGDNSSAVIDALAREILDATAAIEPHAERLELAKRAIREHAPCTAFVDGLGVVAVAAPPVPSAPKVVYELNSMLAPEVIQWLVASGYIVATTPKQKRQTTGVTVTLKRSAA